MLLKLSPKGYVYCAALSLVVCLGVFLRLSVPHISRTIIPGDETTYHYAALNLLKYHTLTREITGDMYSGKAPVAPTSWLSPGYPIYLASIYKIFGASTGTALMSNVAMSIFALFLIYRILDLAEVNRAGKLASMALAAAYPGLLYNLDRLLTEQLFVFLLLLYAYLFLKGLKQSRMALIVASGIVLACAGHVRAQAMPFALISIAWLAVYGQGTAKIKIAHISAFAMSVLALFAPWWIRNYVDFGHFILFSEAGEGAKIWGSVPYFIDMGSSNDGLATVVANNMTPNPAVYYRWRLFGFLQYMWGDVWDEHLVHPGTFLRWMLALQPLVVVPTLLAIPFIASRRSPTVLFIATVPVAFTLMNFPFHGLPRYVYPGVPFVLILTGVAVSHLSGTWCADQWSKTKSPRIADLIMRHGFVALSGILSILIAYSVYAFPNRENLEMSAYRLSRYMRIDLRQADQGKLIKSKVIRGDSIVVENTTKEGGVFVNNIDGPAIVKVADSLIPNQTNKIVTKVTLTMCGGYLYDYTTIYWTGAKTKSISEDEVYKVPTNAFTKIRTVYIDDDVDHLMIVPYVFRGGSFVIQSIEIQKYLVGS